ncbi:MAG TPA: DUF3159 domain-containing protein [Anaerolineales bacterium]|nr:DUF3159 domain-containing protein [Anaerolineales bacterium]
MPDTRKITGELMEEFRSVMGKDGLFDAILPPILFLLLNTFANFQIAMIGALTAAIMIGIQRLYRKQSLIYALAGVGSVGFAIAIAVLFGRSEGYFLPGIVNGGITVALAIVSLLIRKPMVAWTSYLARRWPLEWYWHKQVRPAYTEVTLVWVLFFALRLWWQVALYQGQEVDQLTLVNTLTGWPATILLLIFSYLYGTWRLAQLHGPSVEEFRTGAPAPWQSQRRGF